jgi:phosphate transport system substrate-binding protein
VKAASALAILSLALGGGAAAQTLNLPPPYRPRQAVSGTIRIWGHGAYDRKLDFIGTLVHAWERDFQRYQARVRFENHLVGTAAAIGSLYTGRGDLALMGREIWPPEISAFEEVYGYPPTGVDVVTGSLDVGNRDYALVVFVHRGNPIRGLTLGQLRAIFSVEQGPGAHEIRTWGDLGLTGAWRARPIHLYGLALARGFARYFEQRVFHGDRLWRPSLRTFRKRKCACQTGGTVAGGQRLLDAIARDPDGIGYAGLLYTNSRVRPVALAAHSGDPYVLPTRESVVDHRYPLTRLVAIYFNKRPGRPLTPRLREFLRFVLSRKGQQDVLRYGRGYLPVLAPFAAQQRRKLH